MEIYLLRHPDAEESLRIPDEERSLTAEGRRKLGAVLLRARAAGAGASLILASPLRRAVETELAAGILGTRAPLVKTNALLPGAAPTEVWDEIHVPRDEGQLLLAGHEPLLSQVIAYLLGAPSAQIDMKKGSLARVDLDQFGPAPRGVLRWLLPPQLAA